MTSSRLPAPLPSPPRGRFRALAATVVTLLAAAVAPSAAGADRLWLVSEGVPGDTPAGATSADLMSADGRYVVLTSSSTGWVPGVVDANGYLDVYLWDRVADSYALVSHAAGSEVTAGNSYSQPRAISADGRFVVFESRATDLVPGGRDANWAPDVFVWDRDSRVVTLVSHAAGRATTAGSDWSIARAISADGRYVLFDSLATDLIVGGRDLNWDFDAFLWDRDTEVVTLVSRSASAPTVAGNRGSLASAMSADGRYVAFSSYATDLFASKDDARVTSDAFVWDRETGGVSLVSHVPGASAAPGNRDSYASAMSADGRYVAFESRATDLTTDGNDTNGQLDAFLWDRVSGVVTLVSHVNGSPTVGNHFSEPLAISANGRSVVFVSLATNLIGGGSDANGALDIFVWDRRTRSVSLVSHATSSKSTTGNAQSLPTGISADGRWVAFSSGATDLIVGGSDGNGAADTFLWNRDTAAVTLVSHASGTTTVAANGGSTSSAISANGQYVALVRRDKPARCSE